MKRSAVSGLALMGALASCAQSAPQNPRDSQVMVDAAGRPDRMVSTPPTGAGADTASPVSPGGGQDSASPEAPRDALAAVVPDATARDTTSSTTDTASSTPMPGDAGPAEGLHGFRWELPCKDPNARDTCAWDLARVKPTPSTVKDPAFVLKAEAVKTFGGKADTVYDVTLRFRGVTEPKNFTGGTVEQQHFQVGGTPKADNYNVYSIKVSDPPQTYAVNRHEKKTGHYLFPIDYTVTIKIRGGATVTLGAYDPNNQAIANPGGASGQKEPFVVTGVPPAPAPFLGHFIQMDVVAVTPKS